MVANQRPPVQNPNPGLFDDLKESIKHLPEHFKGPIAEEIQKIEQDITKGAHSTNPQPVSEPFSPNLSWEAILNHLIAGVIFYDPQGIVRLANDYIISLLGFDPVGIPREQLYLRLRIVDTRGKRVSGDQMPASHAAQGETVPNVPLTITMPDGRKYHILASAMPLFEGEQLAGVASVWNDVTGQQNLIDENQRQNALLKKILDSSPYGLAILSSPNLVFRYANSAYRRLSPRPDMDPAGQRLETIWPPEEGHGEGQRLIRSVLESGPAASIEQSRTRMPDGSHRYYSLYALQVVWDQLPAVLVMLWDTTDLVNARHEAQQRAAEFEAIFNAITDTILVYDAGGHLIRVNPAMVQATGCDPRCQERDEFLQKLQLSHPDGSPIQSANLPSSLALNGQESRDIPFQFVDANGTRRVIRASGSPLRDLQGELTGAVTIWHDVTALEQKDRQIEAERDRLKALLESISDEVWFCDPAGNIQRMNDRAPLALGVRHGEDRGGQVNDVTLEHTEILTIDGAPRPDEDTPLLRSLKGELVRGQEMLRNRHTGEIRVREYTSSPIRSKDQILGAVAVVRDITEQKRYEEQLRENERSLKESEERFKVALGSAPLVVFITDRELRYTWIYSPYLGGEADQLIGKRDDEVPFLQDTQELYELKRAVLERGEPLSQEIHIRMAHLPMRLVTYVKPLRNSHGKVVGVIGSALDVTLLRRLEERHHIDIAQVEVQRRLLEHREMEHQQLAQNLHDGPIQRLGSLGFAIRAAQGTAQDRELGTALGQMGDEVNSLIHELREISNELRPPVLVRFGLHKAIQAHADDFQQAHPGLKIQIDLAEKAKKIPSLLVLPLFRIYLESMNNIARHSRAAQVKVRLAFKAEQLVFEIQDNGQGFSPTIDALGLVRSGRFGLVGMKERVEAIGGQFHVATQPNQGTTIRVVIPWSGA